MVLITSIHRGFIKQLRSLGAAHCSYVSFLEDFHPISQLLGQGRCLEGRRKLCGAEGDAIAGGEVGAKYLDGPWS